MIQNPATAGTPLLPAPLTGSIQELANQLMSYGLRLQVIARNGSSLPVGCYSNHRQQHCDLLTAGEARIAWMAAAGSTNTEIADCLHLSPKTVEAHLGRIYRKLAVRSRTELAYLLATRGPGHPTI
jgi:DNA-binding CsgD family transcriptional regulator